MSVSEGVWLLVICGDVATSLCLPRVSCQAAARLKDCCSLTAASRDTGRIVASAVQQCCD